MSHPPIPPSFPITFDPACSCWSVKEDTFLLAEFQSPAREIVAAFAEVEWRKRADRWWHIKGRLLQRERVNETRRFTRLFFARKQAENNADAWRKWGAA